MERSLCDMKFNAGIVSFMLNILHSREHYGTIHRYLCEPSWRKHPSCLQTSLQKNIFEWKTAELNTIDRDLLIYYRLNSQVSTINGISNFQSQMNHVIYRHCESRKRQNERRMNLAPTIKRLVGPIISHSFFIFAGRLQFHSQSDRK